MHKESEEGTVPRKKIRIRNYPNDEKKVKCPDFFSSFQISTFPKIVCRPLGVVNFKYFIHIA